MTTRDYLSAKEQFEATKYTQEHYTEAAMTDAEFAAKAGLALGFALKGSHILGIRKNFEIPATRTKSVVKGPGMELLVELEKRIAAIEQRVEIYLKGCQHVR